MGSTRKWWIADVDKRSPNPFNSQNHYGINEVNYSDANDANTHSLYDLIKLVFGNRPRSAQAFVIQFLKTPRGEAT